MKNGGEVDVDCGGSCGPCAVGRTCGEGAHCESGRCNKWKRCAPACTGLIAELPDAWGERWDGNERGLATFDEAKAACEQLGGRLPTATELYRVSFTQAGGVGQSIHTNNIWSLNPESPGYQIVVRLSDGRTSSQQTRTTDKLSYRCVCPDAAPIAFTEESCHGPADAPCSRLESEGARTQIDVSDRAPLPVGAALWECAFNRGHLAPLITLAEAIRKGLPRPAEAASTHLHTADSATQGHSATVTWKTGETWTPWEKTSNHSLRTFSPFRCAGARDPIGPNASTAPGEWTTPLSRNKADGLDNPPKPWHEAHDLCWSRGGHLARAAELGELVQHGLPNGSNAWLWTADQTGYNNNTQFTAAVLRWNATAPSYGHFYDTFIRFAYKTEAGYAFRCIYYPVDRAYAGPEKAQCQGDCAVFEPGGSGGAKIWIDAFDRTPKLLGDAIQNCADSKGHLAAERDLTEAIRKGLGNGSKNWIWTSDYGSGRHFTVVQWLDKNADFRDQYSTDMTWLPANDTRPYRCMWSNELR